MLDDDGNPAKTPLTNAISIPLDADGNIVDSEEVKHLVISGGEASSDLLKSGVVFSISGAIGAAEKRLFKVVSMAEEEGLQYGITALEYAEDKYDFVDNLVDLEKPPPPGLRTLSPPTNLVMTQELVHGGTSLKSLMRIEWDSDYDETSLISYRVTLTKSNSLSDDGSPNEWTVGNKKFTFEDLVDDTEYDLKIETVDLLGNVSEESIQHTFGFVAGSVPPQDVANLTIDTTTTTAHLSWDTNTDLDFDSYEIRIVDLEDWKANEISDEYIESLPILAKKHEGNDYTYGFLSAKPKMFVVRAKDTSGIYSVNISTHEATPAPPPSPKEAIATPSGYSSLDLRIELPDTDEEVSYEVRRQDPNNPSWESSTLIGERFTNNPSVLPFHTGKGSTLLIKTVSKLGVYSEGTVKCFARPNDITGLKVFKSEEYMTPLSFGLVDNDAGGQKFNRNIYRATAILPYSYTASVDSSVTLEVDYLGGGEQDTWEDLATQTWEDLVDEKWLAPRQDNLPIVSVSRPLLRDNPDNIEAPPSQFNGKTINHAWSFNDTLEDEYYGDLDFTGSSPSYVKGLLNNGLDITTPASVTGLNLGDYFLISTRFVVYSHAGRVQTSATEIFNGGGFTVKAKPIAGGFAFSVNGSGEIPVTPPEGEFCVVDFLGKNTEGDPGQRILSHYLRVLCDGHDGRFTSLRKDSTSTAPYSNETISIGTSNLGDYAKKIVIQDMYITESDDVGTFFTYAFEYPKVGYADFEIMAGDSGTYVRDLGFKDALFKIDMRRTSHNSNPIIDGIKIESRKETSLEDGSVEITDTRNSTRVDFPPGRGFLLPPRVFFVNVRGEPSIVRLAQPPDANGFNVDLFSAASPTTRIVGSLDWQALGVRS